MKNVRVSDILLSEAEVKSLVVQGWVRKSIAVPVSRAQEPMALLARIMNSDTIICASGVDSDCTTSTSGDRKSVV